MKKVLVVDNDQLILEFLKDALLKEGNEVKTARDGLEALEILKAYSPDIIFLDLVMPKIDGKKLCRIIRGTEGLEDAVVVILSAVAAEEDIDAVDLGANMCIAKGPMKETAKNVISVVKQAESAFPEHQVAGVVGRSRVKVRRSARELLSMKKHFETMLERMSEGILEVTPDGTVVYANAAALVMLGKNENELLGTNFRDFFVGREYKRICEVLATVLETPVSVELDDPIALNEFLFAFHTIPLAGEDSTAVIVLNDVTEQVRAREILQQSRKDLERRVEERTTELEEANRLLKQRMREKEEAELALRKSEENYRKLYEESKRAGKVYRSLIESSPDPVAISDLEGRITYVSPEFEMKFGWTLDELKGKRIPFIPESESDSTALMMKELVEEGKSCSGFETKRYTKEGEVLDISLSARRYDDHEGKPEGIISILRDMTETKKLQAQLDHAQKMESLGTIASEMGHSFKNILMGISVNNQLIQMKSRDQEDLMGLANKIAANVEEGTRLIQGILQFSRKDSKKEYKILNLSQVIGTTCDVIKNSAREKLEVEISLPESIPVLGDQSGISQVLMNLCTNALDAMPEGGKLTVKGAQADDHATISVADTGSGMSREIQERCFDPFFTTKESSRGTGLGLSISYGIIKEHDGDIHVYSEEGKGTVFRIDLPLAYARTIDRERSIPNLLRGKGEKVLIADDEKDLLKVVEDLLQSIGYRVTAVDSAKDVLKTCSTWRPDAVLMDRHMPKMDGLRCTREIRKAHPEVKVVLLSGFDHEGPNGIDSESRGLISGYITKPIDLPRLSQVLARVLKEG